MTTTQRDLGHDALVASVDVAAQMLGLIETPLLWIGKEHDLLYANSAAQHLLAESRGLVLVEGRLQARRNVEQQECGRSPRRNCVCPHAWLLATPWWKQRWPRALPSPPLAVRCVLC